MCKQNLSGHECCIMSNHISLSDFVLNRVRCLVSFRILLREMIFDLWLCVPRGFDPWCSLVQPKCPTRPDPAQPSPAQLGPRAPGTPCSPCAPLVPFLSFDFSRVASSLSPISLSPRGALGFGDGDRRSWIPEVSSPPFSSLSLFLFLPLPFPARTPFFYPACAPPVAPRRSGSLAPWRGGPGRSRRDSPAPLRRGGSLPPRRGGSRPLARDSPALPRGGLGPRRRAPPAPPRAAPWPLPGVAPRPPPRRPLGPSLARPHGSPPTRLPWPPAAQPLALGARSSRCAAPAFDSVVPRRGPGAARVASARPVWPHPHVHPTRSRVRSPTCAVIDSLIF
jgi:hypothetical protein